MFKPSVVLLATLVIVPALGGTVDHHALAKRAKGSPHNKRDARMTWYDITTGETACGDWYSPSDYVVAMNKEQYESYDWCGVELTIEYNNQTVKAKVVDMCEGCPAGALDLTSGLFNALTGDLGTGVIYTNWYTSTS